jgi:hypothetical protein
MILRLCACAIALLLSVEAALGAGDTEDRMAEVMRAAAARACPSVVTIETVGGTQ